MRSTAPAQQSLDAHGGWPLNRSRIEVGNALRENEGTSRADSSTNGALVVNGPCHQQKSQRRRVRAECRLRA